MAVVETVKIVSKNKGGYVIINRADFDADAHILFSVVPEEKEKISIPKQKTENRKQKRT